MTTRHGLHALVLLIACALCAPWAQAAALKKGRLFPKVRQELIASGWQPVRLRAEKRDSVIGVETELLREGVLEVESCAMDKAVCLFNYRRKGRCLPVITRGEAYAGMRVQGWRGGCS